MSQFSPEHPEHQAEALAFEMSQKIFQLIETNPGSSLRTIAEMLGASQFLSLEDAGRGKAPVLHLDVKAFVQDLKRNKTLYTLALPTSVDTSPKTILPPDEGEIITGSGTGIEKKNIIPRTRYLMEVLQELNVPYEVHGGTNSPQMMRTLSYQVFVIPSMEKMVLVNNEEGNATFIVHGIDIRKTDPENSWEHFAYGLTKELLKSLGGEKVSTVFFNMPLEEWKAKLTELIVFGPEKTVGTNEKKSEIKQRTIESATQELVQAFEKWKSNPEDARGVFNSYWLKKNGYIGLYNWTYNHTSLLELVAKSKNEELQKAFTKLKEKYTEESAIETLIEAFEKWKLQTQKIRHGFNQKWLIKNGYSGVVGWARSNTSLLLLITKSKNEEIKLAFTKLEIRDKYTEETAIKTLIEAFEKWKSEPEENRGDFNQHWLEKNGYGGLKNWAINNISLQELATKSKNEELQTAFKKRHVRERYTEQSATETLIEAFEKWKSEPEENRGDFNQAWLKKNGYDGLIFWTHRHTPLSILIVKSGNVELQKTFTKAIKKYTEESAIQVFVRAFEEWRKLPEEIQGEFHSEWLEKNKYGGLVQWARRNTPLSTLMIKSGNKELQAAFTKLKIRENFTEQTVILLLIEAFEKWKSESLETSSIFNQQWLYNNGYGGLKKWTKKNISIPELIAKSGNEEMQQAFVKQEHRQNFTEQSAIQTLIQAFEVWKKLPEKTRGKFGTRWLNLNKYGWLLFWAQKHTSVPELVAKSGNEELQKIFVPPKS